MKTSNTDAFHAAELKRLEDSRKRIIHSKEAEIKNIQNEYGQKAEQTKAQNERKYFDIKSQHDRDVLNAMKVKEERLSAHRDDLLKTVKTLDNQKEQIVQNNKFQLESLNDSFEENATIKIMEQDQALKQIDLDANAHIEKAQASANGYIREANFSAQNKMDELTTTHDAKFEKELKNFEQRKDQKQLENYSALAEQKMDHDSKLNKYKMKSLIEARQIAEVHEKSIDNEKNLFKEKLKSQREAFKGKLKALVDSHETLYQKLQKQFSTEIKSMTENHSAKKRDLASKQLDDFYHVTTLTPQIKDMPKEYQISLRVPEHEQEGVKINAHDREIRIHLTRNFTDEFKEMDGTLNKSRRSEVVSRTFQVPEIVDHSKATSTYKDGILTFMVPKK